MQLILPLASTNADAPSGTAEFYEYSASDPFGTPAVIYDENGTPLGTSVSLDSNGSKICYAKDGRVRVLVKNAAGTALRNYVVWSDDAAITVETSNFTGTDPETGAQTAGMPTLLRAAWNLIRTSFGAADGKVKITGGTTEQYLKDALAGLRATNFPLFNVKDTVYGATGDGTTDDGPAIQAAITAAAVAGGIVFFPAGTYRTVQALSCPSPKVSFLGCGALASIVKSATAGNVCLTITGGTSSPTQAFIRNLGIDHSSTGTTWAVQIVTAPGFTMEGVVISNHQKGINPQTRVVLRDCDVTAATGGTNEPLSFTTSSAGSEVHGGAYVLTTAAADVTAIRSAVVDVLVTGAKMKTVGHAATVTYGFTTSAANNRVIGCAFDIVGAGAVDFAMRVTADVAFYEDDNAFLDADFFGQFLSGALTYASIFRGSRLRQHATYAAAASAVVNTDKYTHLAIANANYTWNINASGAVADNGTYTHGAEMVLLLYNSTGGDITESWGTTNQRVDAPGNLAAGATRSRRLVYDSALADWVQVGASVDVT